MECRGTRARACAHTAQCAKKQGSARVLQAGESKDAAMGPSEGVWVYGRTEGETGE